MNIQYYGDYCFKIVAKPGGRATEDIVIWTDPCDKSTGLRSPQGQADIIFLSHDNGVDVEAAGLKGERATLRNPGEYAIKGINAFGIASYQDMQSGAERGQNTVFVFQAESLNLCFLGALGHELTPAQIEKIAAVDILFIPVGNHDTLAIKQLDDVIRKIEPSLVVPMHYKMDGLHLPIEDEQTFCAEIGNCPSEKIAKLTVKKKDLEGKSMEIVIFEKA
ncbi:MAG: MBL fold metallo-hydrolase [Candidatus Moranbacteria bacterium]|nr:MBL fold metallo-hydrolase [Candidatus Moranbacteria bacterium]